MNETQKTLTFFAIAIAACAAAYWAQPSAADFDVESLEGKLLAEQFDSEKAKRMEIVSFDEDSATLTEFEVAEENGVWTIPSKGGYPADAERQMAEAATGVMDREILDVVSGDAADHEQYGVVDPNSPKLTVGQTGVGKRVTLYDETDEALVDLIIGRPVTETENQHYVRVANQDPVYAVEINPEDFSTSFEDWIEDDLLTISPWDIKKVRLNDYSAEMLSSLQGIRVRPDYRTDIVLEYDDTESEWSPVVLKQATDPLAGTFEEFTLDEDQELATSKLNELKNALDDLRIVDVNKKPAGLSASLKAGDEFMNDLEAQLSLIQRGFAPVASGNGDAEILASEGEVVASMKDGVEYVLRFGNLRLTASEQASGTSDADDAEGAAPDQEDVNRYLFVMARFNEDLIEKPELEVVPELPEGVTQEQVDAATDDAATDAAAGEEQAADGASGDEAGADAASEDAATDDPSAGEEAADASADDGQSQTDLEKAIAERKQIEQANQRKLDEYTTKIKEGKEHVEELNARFGDWYYVISNDVFKKIHLGRDDVIKQKEADDDSAADDASADSPLGQPGGAIPGMPDLSAVDGGTEEVTTPPVEEGASEAPAENEAETPMTEAATTDDGGATADDQRPAQAPAEEPATEDSPSEDADESAADSGSP